MDWWEEKWGEPTYGGILTFRCSFVDVITDPAQDPRPTQFGAYMEQLFCDDMTLERSVYPFRANFVPIEYKQGWMAKGWEQIDPLTINVTLNEGITWHDKSPTYGREFTAEDVAFAWARVLGNGYGFTQSNPFYGPNVQLIDTVTALDDYTVQFKLKVASPMAIYQVTGPTLSFGFTAPEWWEQSEEERNDWHNVTGTGAFILSDFVPGTSIEFERNENYWAYDERFPENKLPYMDGIKFLAIPDAATAAAALRTEKVDMIVDGRDHLSYDQATSIAKTNPDIIIFYWNGTAGSATFKYGAEPFDDIRVRTAMQLAIDGASIVEGYYHDLGDATPVPMASLFLGEAWADPYDSWPKELQDEYGYNPEKAKELLTDAGYPNGFSTNILLSSQDDAQLCQVFKDMWNQIGVDVTIDLRDPVTAGFMTRGATYDQMVFGGAGGGTNPPYEAILNFWSKYGQTAGGVDDPTYDAFVDDFNSATTTEDCQSIFKEASRYSIEQHFQVLLGLAYSAQAYQPWIKGWDGENLWSVPQWAYYQRMWIDSSLKE